MAYRPGILVAIAGKADPGRKSFPRCQFYDHSGNGRRHHTGMSLHIKDRIKELRHVPASSLLDNPKNWRTHSDEQLKALDTQLKRIGFAGAILAFELEDGRLMMIDGHARKSISSDEIVPVLVTDLNEQEADELLATFDPVGAMAGTNQDKLKNLLDEMSIDGPLGKMLSELAGDEEKSDPKEVKIDLTPQYAVMVKVPDEARQKQLMQQADDAGFENSAVVTGFAEPKKVEQIDPPAAGVVRITRETAIKRTARVRQVEGMFDLPAAESIRRDWDYKLDLPEVWNLGVIVGPSGSGKTTLAREWFGDNIISGWDWPADGSIVDGFPEDMPIQEVTGILSSVGFSSPPGWTKPYHVLSNGEKFRVDVARTLAEKPGLAVIDEFTSVVDRTVAQIGSAAIAKAVRQTGRRLVAVSCHYDIIDWLCPDWVLDVETGQVTRRSVRRRPEINLDIRRADRSTWKLFSQHHYLDHDIHKGAACYVAKVDGRPAAFIGVMSAPHPSHPRWRASRIVCLPDFQGVGVGTRMTDAIAAAYYATGKEFCIVSSHPAMIATLARSSNWRCNRSYSTSTMSTTMIYTGDRIKSGFVFKGEPRPDYATALGLIKR